MRGASILEGLTVVRLTNDAGKRSELRERLRTAGCAVIDDHSMGTPFPQHQEAASIAVGTWGAGHIDVQVVAGDRDRRSLWFEEGTWHFKDEVPGEVAHPLAAG